MSQESWQPAFPLIELLMVLCVIALLLPTIEAEHDAAPAAARHAPTSASASISLPLPCTPRAQTTTASFCEASAHNQ